MNYIDYITTVQKPEYEVYANLYTGNHYKVFGINQYEYFTDKNQYIVYNFPEILTNTINDLIWNEPPRIQFENQNNQDRFDQFKVQTSLMIKLREATTTSSFAGDSVVRLTQTKGQINLEQIDNNIWFPIYNPSSPRSEATGHILRYSKKLDGNRESVLLEIHTAGQIEYQAYSYQNAKYTPENAQLNWLSEIKNILVDGEIAQKSGQFIYKTKCEYPLVFVISNIKSGNCHYGQSDYTLPIISKVYGINSLLNQSQSVLRRHANPKMIVPRSLISQTIQEMQNSDKKANEFGFGTADLALKQFRSDRTWQETLVAQKLVNKMEFFGTDINTTEPKYLTWDGNLESSEKQLHTLLNACYDESQLSKILIDPTATTGDLSGVAIMRMCQQSLNKASKKQAYIMDTLAKMLFSWCQLSGLEPQYPSIKFKDGLVNDLKETIENQELLLNNQLTSRLDAIQVTRDMTLEQAQEVLNEIDNVL